MEFKQVLGVRRSIRYFDPDRPVEREKIQKILEAMRIASCAVNAHWLRAVVVNRADIPPATLEALKTPVAGAVQELAPVHIYCYLDTGIVTRVRGTRLRSSWTSALSIRVTAGVTASSTSSSIRRFSSR
jgi:nitroreductase